MIKRMLFVFLLSIILVVVGTADTVPQFMFKTTGSMCVREGQPSLLISPGAEKLLDGGYELELTVTERGGIDAAIDRILVHVFDNDQETNAFESTITPEIIPSNQTIILKERLNVRSGQWIGYEISVGERSFYSLCQCGVNEAASESADTSVSFEESVSSEPVIASEPADVVEATEEQAAEIAVITPEKTETIQTTE